MAKGRSNKGLTGGFGYVENRGQKDVERWRATYHHMGRKHSAPGTFGTQLEALNWLADERELIQKNPFGWVPPRERMEAARKAHQTLASTFAEYAAQWLPKHAEEKLKERTRADYERMLRDYLLPTFGHMPMVSINAEHVKKWHSETLQHAPTQRAHAYSLLHLIFKAATQDGLARNPVNIERAGKVANPKKPDIATKEEIAIIEEHMPERLRLMVTLACWTALRFGELAELRRKDINLANQEIHVTRAVVRVNGGHLVTTPKSSAGIRKVSIPPHIMPRVVDHLERFTAPGKNSLLFPAADGESHISTSTLYGKVSKKTGQGQGYYYARIQAGRPDLPFHGLRHTGATWFAQTGATIKELMDRLGHTSTSVAMRYQQDTPQRRRESAQRLSQFAEESE